MKPPFHDFHGALDVQADNHADKGLEDMAIRQVPDGADATLEGEVP